MSQPSLLILSFRIPQKYAGKIPGIGNSFLLPGKYFLLKRFRYSLSSIENRVCSLENGPLPIRTFLDFCLQWSQGRQIRLIETMAGWDLSLTHLLQSDGIVVFEKKSKGPEILIFDPLEKVRLRRLLQLNREPSPESE